MKDAGRREQARLDWAAAGGLALAGLGLAALVPEWNWPEPKLCPPAPRIVLADSAHGSAPAAWETRAVRSPSLIALDGGALVAGAAVRRTPELHPPLQVPPARPAGLGLPAARPAAKPAADGGLLRRAEISVAGAYSGILEAPVFRKAPAGGVTLEYLGGLAGKYVALDGWSWEPWTRAEMPWTMTLDLQTDARGRITRVLLDAPAVEPSLKDDLIQSLYERGRLQPPGPGRGRVIVSYPGAS